MSQAFDNAHHKRSNETQASTHWTNERMSLLSPPRSFERRSSRLPDADAEDSGSAVDMLRSLRAELRTFSNRVPKKRNRHVHSCVFDVQRFDQDHAVHVANLQEEEENDA